MDPRHLVQLATILEQGSISRASAHLHLSQPTLTHNMQTLEMQAGGKLFERSRFGVRSTLLGDMLAREGRAIARRLKDASEASARHRGGLRRTLRIGAGPLIGAAVLPQLAQELLRQYPDLHLTLQCDRPHLLVDHLVDGRHDMVIAPSWLDRPPPGIERILLVEDALAVFCGAGHPLAAEGILAMGVGVQQNWIVLGTASPFDQHVRSMLTEAGVATPRTELTIIGEAFVLLGTLAQGKHLSVLPRFPVRLLRRSFPVVELALPVQRQPRHIHLWCRTTLLEDPFFIAVRKCISAHAKDCSERR